jgi:CRISPR type I-E-associated protein CasB/Cse2
MPNNTEPKDTFLDQLIRLANDRGDRAALRRYWSPATRHQSYPLLGRLNAIQDRRKTITAALYSVHPENHPGVTVGKAALLLGDRKGGEHPYDRHFRRLLASDDLDDLAAQLFRLVKRLQREGIGLGYDRLYKDLNYWAGFSEDVKVRWAADFWQAPVFSTVTEDTGV